MDINTILITKYCSAWFWHLTAIILFSVDLLFMALKTIPFAVGFAIITGIAEFMAIKRQTEFYEVKNGEK